MYLSQALEVVHQAADQNQQAVLDGPSLTIVVECNGQESASGDKPSSSSLAADIYGQTMANFRSTEGARGQTGHRERYTVCPCTRRPRPWRSMHSRRAAVAPSAVTSIRETVRGLTFVMVAYSNSRPAVRRVAARAEALASSLWRRPERGAPTPLVSELPAADTQEALSLRAPHTYDDARDRWPPRGSPHAVARGAREFWGHVDVVSRSKVLAPYHRLIASKFTDSPLSPSSAVTVKSATECKAVGTLTE